MLRKAEFSLHAPQPFSLKATVLSHGWHECAPMSWSEGGGCFQIIERVGDRAGRVSVVEGRAGSRRVALRVTVEAETLDDADLDRIARNLRITLGLDHDLADFHALCANDSSLHVVPRLGGGRVLRSVSMAENIIKALCATNVNWAQAVKMINRLGQLGPFMRDFRHLNAWPTPREILRAGESYLIDVCRVGYRAETILAFCRDVCAKRFDPEELDRLAGSVDVTSDDILARLRGIRGIGPSSAHFLLSLLGRHDRLSIDSATVAHVARVHLNGRKPTNGQIEKIYARYGRWKNLAWWCEHWLTWGTARQMLQEAGLDHSIAKRERAK